MIQPQRFTELVTAQKFAVWASHENKDHFFYIYRSTDGTYIVDFDPTYYSDEKLIETYYKAERQ